MISFITNLFSGPIQVLQDAINFLANLASVSGAGINLSDYFAWIGILDPAFQRVVNSALASLAFVGILIVVRAIYRFYLSIKEGIQWW